MIPDERPRWGGPLDVEALPRLMRPEHARCYAKPIREAEKAFCNDWVRRHFEASTAAWDFAKGHGANSFYRPFCLNPDLCQITTFTFAEKTSHPAWRFQRQRQGYYPAAPNPKSDAGKAMKALIEQLPRYPAHSEIDAFAGLMTDLNYVYDTGAAGTGLGDPTTGFYVGQLIASVAGRAFLVFPNPFTAIAAVLGRHPDAEFKADTDPRLWRLPIGWRLVTKADTELAFAQDKVAAEAASDEEARRQAVAADYE